MSIGKKIAHTLEGAKGATKKFYGRAPPATPACAPRDASISSHATPNRAGAKVKDAFKH